MAFFVQVSFTGSRIRRLCSCARATYEEGEVKLQEQQTALMSLNAARQEEEQLLQRCIMHSYPVCIAEASLYIDQHYHCCVGTACAVVASEFL